MNTITTTKSTNTTAPNNHTQQVASSNESVAYSCFKKAVAVTGAGLFLLTGGLLAGVLIGIPTGVYLALSNNTQKYLNSIRSLSSVNRMPVYNAYARQMGFTDRAQSQNVATRIDQTVKAAKTVGISGYYTARAFIATPVGACGIAGFISIDTTCKVYDKIIKSM